MKQYIFGYGSLIEKASRLRTTPSAKKAYPVAIQGYSRGWFARTGTVGFSTTFLGCIESGGKGNDSDASDMVNGVIYEVDATEIKLTDEREQGYKRTRVPDTAIDDYSKILEPGAEVWVYLNQFSSDRQMQESLPSGFFPIVQSYVDICLNGCLEMEATFEIAKEKKFAQTFITSTRYWSNHWANDRIYPRRPFIYSPNSSTIDQLLKEHLPDKSIFDKIYIE